MSPPAQTEIEEALTCQCGCGLTVHSCNHVQCPSGIPLKKEIAEQIALGKSRDDVLAYFAVTYGEKVLSAPTTTGFNIVAWVMPFAAVLVATVVVMRAARRWTRRTVSQPAPPPDPAVASDPDEVRRRAELARDLDRWDS